METLRIQIPCLRIVLLVGYRRRYDPEAAGSFRLPEPLPFTES